MPENNKLGLVARDIDDRDVPRANLVFGQLRARNLPIPAAVFAEKLARMLEAMQSDASKSRAQRRVLPRTQTSTRAASKQSSKQTTK